MITSAMTLVWFLTAHILEYTSVNTCRFDAPHLWWLTFGILCILYLMILEIFLLGLLVFILGPVIFVSVLSNPYKLYDTIIVFSYSGISSSFVWVDTRCRIRTTFDLISANSLRLLSIRFHSFCTFRRHPKKMMRRIIWMQNHRLHL